MDERGPNPEIREILEQLVEAGEKLVDLLPPDLGFQVELSLGELVVLLGQAVPYHGGPMMSHHGPDTDEPVH